MSRSAARNEHSQTGGDTPSIRETKVRQILFAESYVGDVADCCRRLLAADALVQIYGVGDVVGFNPFAASSHHGQTGPSDTPRKIFFSAYAANRPGRDRRLPISLHPGRTPGAP